MANKTIETSSKNIKPRINFNDYINIISGPNNRGPTMQNSHKIRSSLSYQRVPVAQSVQHWIVMREVVSSTLAGPTLRVLK